MTSLYSSPSEVNILIAAGKPYVLNGMKHLLQSEGYLVELAADSNEALSTLRKAGRLPDMIVSDVDLPPSDGFDLLRAVRENQDWAGTPFLILTGQTGIEAMREGYLLGADDCLPKPLDREHFLLVVRSKLVRQAQLLEQIRLEKQALDAAKRSLSLMVSHELRTPLVSINMATEILAREINQMDPHELQEIVEVMHNGSSRMSRVVEQIIMFVTLESGALKETLNEGLRPSPVRDAVIGAIDRARQFTYQRRENPVLFDELDPDALIRCDLGALKHALAEVISNAMTFSRPDQPVHLMQWVSDDKVWVTITDYGPGIPEEKLAHAFEPYQQYNRDKYEQQGIGIGLPLSRGIIEAHGGTFELCSVPGRGTQVIIGLPVCDICSQDDILPFDVSLPERLAAR
jgi:signal transduction histidine kinase